MLVYAPCKKTWSFLSAKKSGIGTPFAFWKNGNSLNGYQGEVPDSWNTQFPQILDQALRRAVMRAVYGAIVLVITCSEQITGGI
jgi:hypothetical protein